MTNTQDSLVRHRYLLFIILICMLTYVLNFVNHADKRSVLYGDPTVQSIVTESIYTDGDVDLRNQLKGKEDLAADQIALGKNGQWYPEHEFLLAIITVPLYALFGIFSFILINWIVLIFLCYLMFSLATKIFGVTAGSVATLLTFLSPPFVEYSYSFSSDLFGALIVCGTFYLIVEKKYFYAGLVGGLIFFARLPFAICNVGMLLFLAFQLLQDGHGNSIKALFNLNRYKFILRFSLGMLPLFLFFLIQNKVMFGSFFALSYMYWVQIEPGSITPLQIAKSTDPFLYGLNECLFSPDTGLFVSSPLTVFGFFVGVPLLLRQVKSAALLYLFIFVCQIALFSYDFVIVPAFPNRYLLPLYALNVIPLSALIRFIEAGGNNSNGAVDSTQPKAFS